MQYQLIRSARRTLAIEISREMELIVRAPMRMSRGEIERFLREKADWIEIHMGKARQRAINRPQPTEADEARCRETAKKTLPGLVAKYAPLVGAWPAGIAVTGAATRFGSCSAKGRVCFSWRLFLYPPECAEYVVVHELCHLLHMDHSPAFWKEVERVMPDYRARQKILRGEV